MWVELLRRMSDHNIPQPEKEYLYGQLCTFHLPHFATDMRNGLGIHKTKCLYDWAHTSYNNKITWLCVGGKACSCRRKYGISWIERHSIRSIRHITYPSSFDRAIPNPLVGHWLASHCRRTTTWLGPNAGHPFPHYPLTHMNGNISQANRLIKSVALEQTKVRAALQNSRNQLKRRTRISVRLPSFRLLNFKRNATAFLVVYMGNINFISIDLFSSVAQFSLFIPGLALKLTFYVCCCFFNFFFLFLLFGRWFHSGKGGRTVSKPKFYMYLLWFRKLPPRTFF